jgi:hypothetical protein
MKKLASSLCIITFFGTTLIAQQQPLAFYKRCLVASISGGPSSALYSTKTNDGRPVHSDNLSGHIDPIITEYGLTNRFGIGTSKGGETYYLNANTFYNANVPQDYENMFSTTKYLTLDLSYHPYVTKRLDVSVFTGIGYYNVSGSCYNTDTENWYASRALFSYNGQGAVARAGVRTRFYFTKRLGIMGMLYAFNGYVKEKPTSNNVSDRINNSGYSTTLTGFGAEFGLCYRFFKQKGVILEMPKVRKEKERKVREGKIREGKVNEGKLEKIKERIEDKQKEEDDNEKIPLFRLVWG